MKTIYKTVEGTIVSEFKAREIIDAKYACNWRGRDLKCRVCKEECEDAALGTDEPCSLIVFGNSPDDPDGENYICVKRFICADCGERVSPEGKIRHTMDVWVEKNDITSVGCPTEENPDPHFVPNGCDSCDNGLGNSCYEIDCSYETLVSTQSGEFKADLCGNCLSRYHNGE